MLFDARSACVTIARVIHRIRMHAAHPQSHDTLCTMKRRDRAQFEAEELAVVLSHFDLGVIESVTEFERGSRNSPKLGVVSERGKFLLKRREKARGDMDRVRFIHDVQRRLKQRNFPLPHLVPPRVGGESFLQWKGAVYELFEFVAGHSYTGEPEETRDAGRTLAVFHESLTDLDCRNRHEHDGYHNAVAVQTGLNAIPKSIRGHDSAAGKDAELLGLTSFLFEAYCGATEAVDALGYDGWPSGITHSDWHPGNLLFKRGQVISVIDYDCVKLGKPVCDVGNGVLQFSIIGGSQPRDWPNHLHLDRAADFINGYLESAALTPQQLQAIPHLMIEALIAEAVLPIAATGSFGPFAGFGFMRMVRRKVEWLQTHLGQLQAVA